MNFDLISPFDDVKEFTDFSQDIDLTASTSSVCERAARGITIVAKGSGALAVIMMSNDRVPTARVLTGLTDGEKLELKVLKIKATGTSVAKVRVGW